MPLRRRRDFCRRQLYDAAAIDAAAFFFMRLLYLPRDEQRCRHYDIFADEFRY